MKELHVGMAIICPFHLQHALSNSGLRWVMHPAQWMSIQNSIMYKKMEVSVVKIKEGEAVVANVPETVNTFFGIPVDVIHDINKSLIELRRNNEVLFRIDQLAIPLGFPE